MTPTQDTETEEAVMLPSEGADGAAGAVIFDALDDGNDAPPSLMAVTWKSYDVPDDKDPTVSDVDDVVPADANASDPVRANTSYEVAPVTADHCTTTDAEVTSPNVGVSGVAGGVSNDPSSDESETYSAFLAFTA